MRINLSDQRTTTNKFDKFDGQNSVIILSRYYGIMRLRLVTIINSYMVVIVDSTYIYDGVDLWRS